VLHATQPAPAVVVECLGLPELQRFGDLSALFSTNMCGVLFLSAQTCVLLSSTPRLWSPLAAHARSGSVPKECGFGGAQLAAATRVLTVQQPAAAVVHAMHSGKHRCVHMHAAMLAAAVAF
jgi:hypothetical protein